MINETALFEWWLCNSGSKGSGPWCQRLAGPEFLQMQGSFFAHGVTAVFKSGAVAYEGRYDIVLYVFFPAGARGCQSRSGCR